MCELEPHPCGFELVNLNFPGHEGKDCQIGWLVVLHLERVCGFLLNPFHGPLLLFFEVLLLVVQP